MSLARETLPSPLGCALPTRRYDFPSPWWDTITGGKGKDDGAKDLVKRCLTVDPKKRITAGEVLKFPWICGNAPDVAIDLTNLKKFQVARRLRGDI